MRCPGHDPEHVPTISNDDAVRLTCEGSASEYHLSDAHPHVFCGCGSEAADCHPTRCCKDGELGECANCGRPADHDPRQPGPDDVPLFEVGAQCQ